MKHKPKSDTKSSKSNNHAFIWLILIIILSISIRLYNINSESIWTDESISVHFGLRDIKDIFWSNDPTPPLHSILLHYWIDLFGISAIAVRSLSVLFSVACVYMIYLVGNLINKKIGLYAALMLAISPISIFYAQEARTYSLLFLMTLLSMYFYIKYLQKSSKTNIALYIISTVLMVYSHIYGIFIILAQTIDYILRKKGLGKDMWKHLWKWVMIQAAILILYLPWLITLPRIIAINYNSFSQNTLKTTISAFMDLFAQLTTGIIVPIFGGVLLLIFIGLIVLFLLSKEKKSTVLLWFGIPIIIPLIITILWIPIYSVRHACLAIIPFILLIALGLDTLPKKIKIITFTIIIILTLGCVLIQQNTHTKDDWRSIDKYIIEKNVSQTAIMSWYEAVPLSYYYHPECLFTSQDQTTIYKCLKPAGLIAIQGSDDLNDIKGEKVLLITSRIDSTPKSEEYINTLKGRYYFTENVTFYAYNKTIFTNGFFNKVDPSNRAFNRVIIYTLVKK